MYRAKNIATSGAGWPTDAGQGPQSNCTTLIDGDFSRCRRIWSHLLQNTAAKASEPEVSDR